MKDIHIEFAGGLWDGEHLHGNSYDGEEGRLAKRCYWATRAGAVGKHLGDLSAKERHRLGSEAARGERFDAHRDYVVTVHVESEEEIFVRLECADEDLRA